MVRVPATHVVCCRRVDRNLLVLLPLNWRRLLWEGSALAIILVSIPLAVFLVSGENLFTGRDGILYLGIGIFCVVLHISWRFLRRVHVLVTPTAVMLRTSRLWTSVRTHALDANSRASHWVEEDLRGICEGVAISTQQGEVRFGEQMAKDEILWVVDTINEYLTENPGFPQDTP